MDDITAFPEHVISGSKLSATKESTSRFGEGLFVRIIDINRGLTSLQKKGCFSNVYGDVQVP
jgi:hypothetical protein